VLVIAALVLTACATTTSKPATFGSTVAAIKARGTLRDAVVDAEPYNFKDPATGQWKGLEYETAKYLADQLGVKLVIDETTFANVVTEIQSGRADIAAPGLYATPARSIVITFSIPYRTDGELFLIRKTDANRWKTTRDFNDPGVTISIATGSADEAIVARDYPKAKVLGSDEQGRIDEVLAGRADATLLGYTSAKQYAAAHDWAAYFPADGKPFGATDLVIGMPYGAMDLKAFVDATLEYMNTQGLMQQLIDKYGF
jgi:ABC-type amino acid transport substrate-binding protein